jgi:AAA15 family ATPase/GTPase
LFQSPKTNRSGAQIVFTTHDTELLNLELLRKDQLYFVDKNRDSGASELYGLDEYATHTRDNIQKGYMAGKYGAVPDIEIEEIE